MEKLCECGCKKPTKIIMKNGKSQGRKKGGYNKFINGHNSRINNPSKIPEIIEKIRQKTIERWNDEDFKQKQKRGIKNYYKIHKHPMTGKLKSGIQKERMSLTRKEWYKKNPIKAKLKALKCSETKKRQETSNLEKNPMWRGGLSFEPYGIAFNNQLKAYIRWMDNYTCQQCGIPEAELGYQLHIHHIDFNKKNNTIQNLISLCKICHGQTNFNRQDWVNYFQNKLNSEVKNGRQNCC